MNVLKADFISKQKRLQSRRKKVVKTFFSGYHTISDVASTASGFPFPKNITNKAPSPKFSINFSSVDESVEPKSLSTYSSEAVTRERSTTNKYTKLSDRKDQSTSTSLEFQRLLKPFLNFGEDLTHTNEESDRNSGKMFHNVIESDTETEEDNVLKSLNLHRKTPKSLEKRLKNLNKDTFDQYNIPSKEIVENNISDLQVDCLVELNNFQHVKMKQKKHTFKEIFSLPAPKNQKSIEEVLTSKGSRLLGSSKLFPSPDSKTRNSSLDIKTPKTKLGKSPRVSSSSRTFQSSDSGAYILAVTEGRGHARGEVGIAAMDPKRPHLVLCQISDNQRYVHSLTKMNVFDFVEVIVPNTFVDCSTPNKLYSDIRSTFPKVTLTSVQRRHFNESIGVDLIRQYCSMESTSVMVLLRDKFYALSAAAALVRYVEFTQNVRLAPHSLKIEYQGMEDTMIIDLNTANLLELVLCVSHPETNLNHSLLGVIKYCRTKGGIRLLRANILQPPCSVAKIEARLDCVTELVNNPLLLCALEAAVSNFSNLEDLLNLCMHAPQQDGLKAAEFQLKYTLLLKTMLELLPTLHGALGDAKSEFFCEVRENLGDLRYSMILDRILQTIIENAKTVKGSVAAHLHGCFAVKAGINSLLDVAKKTYCEIVQEISDHVTQLREKHNMPLRLGFSANKGFHIQYTLPPGQRNMTQSSLPSEFILAQKSKTTFSFYTAELVALDQRSQHVLNEIKLMTNVILYELLTDIRQYIGCIFNLCEYIAEIDVLVSFAHVGSGTNYVRPKFGQELDLKDSRHPILDVIYDGEVVANDVFAKAGKNFTILTGPNQSGKSIYIRQIALLQIMAQIGCYVPAKEATFRLTDRIFSRLGFDDNIESNASTLIVEMKDIEYLKQNKTPRSLVVIDELCRGTSVDEGTSLAFAICEELLDTSAFIFFTTHYLFLTKLEELYFNVTNYHFESKIETTPSGKPSIQFTHKRKPGVTTADSYGLLVAEMTSFPKEVYNKAKEIAVKLSAIKKPSREVSGLVAMYELSLQLKSELVKLDPEKDWEKMESIIKNYKQSYEKLKQVSKNTHKSDSNGGDSSKSLQNPNTSSFSNSTTNSKTDQRSTSPERLNTEGNTNKENVLKLAKSILNKYKKIINKKQLGKL